MVFLNWFWICASSDWLNVDLEFLSDIPAWVGTCYFLWPWTSTWIPVVNLDVALPCFAHLEPSTLGLWLKHFIPECPLELDLTRVSKRHFVVKRLDHESVWNERENLGLMLRPLNGQWMWYYCPWLERLGRQLSSCTSTWTAWTLIIGINLSLTSWSDAVNLTS